MTVCDNREGIATVRDSHTPNAAPAKWTKLTGSGFVLLPWLVAAAGILGAKYFVLRLGGFHESALATPSGVLTFWEKVSLFRADLLLGAVFIPLLLCALTYLLPLGWRIALSTAAAYITGFGVGIEVACYDTTGAFISLKLIWAALHWMISNHNTGIVTIPLRGPVMLLAWLIVLFATAALAVVAARRSVRSLSYAGLVVLALGCVATAIASAPRVHEMAWSPSLLGLATSSMFESSADEAMLARSTPELLSMYRQSAHVPAPQPVPFGGKAKGFNVILFVIESMPTEVVDPARDGLGDMPNLRQLREHSFVAERHYTTFPATNLASFALLSSLYSRDAPGALIGEHNVKLPGLVRTLKNSGYKSGFYGFVWKTSSQRDDLMLASLGFDKVVEPPADQAIESEGAETFTGPSEFVAQRDREILDVLRHDVRGWTKRNERFVAAFFPQLSHDPWRDLQGHQSGSARERGRALAAYQDAWLGELMHDLEENGALEHTIIVVTADHGVRTMPAMERAPTLTNNVINDSTVHVPFLVYVPKVLEHPVTISSPTSHIDVTPTLLDLLGETTGREIEQGTELWNSGLKERRLFVSTIGAGEFYENGRYYMRSSANTIFMSANPKFGDKDALPFDSSNAAAIRRIFEDHDKVQQGLLFHVFGNRNVR